jgi:hypothetical protein
MIGSPIHGVQFIYNCDSLQDMIRHVMETDCFLWLAVACIPLYILVCFVASVM